MLIKTLLLADNLNQKVYLKERLIPSRDFIIFIAVDLLPKRDKSALIKFHGLNWISFSISFL